MVILSSPPSLLPGLGFSVEAGAVALRVFAVALDLVKDAVGNLATDRAPGKQVFRAKEFGRLGDNGCPTRADEQVGGAARGPGWR